jgi:hypothetical protein
MMINSEAAFHASIGERFGDNDGDKDGGRNEVFRFES